MWRLLPLILLPTAAFSQDAPYLDDRSDPAALVRSYYNAVDRHEYARAFGYFSEDMAHQDYASFVKGYAETDRVTVKLGPVVTEGAAGSIYATVPTAIRATDTNGAETIYAGCITTRAIQPAIQEPPFRPIQIFAALLHRSESSLDRALPASCESK